MAEASTGGGAPWAELGGYGWLASTADGVVILPVDGSPHRRADFPHHGWVSFHGAVEVAPGVWRVDWEAEAESATLRAASGGRRTTEVRT